MKTEQTTETLEQACTLLRQFVCLNQLPQLPDLAATRRALQLVAAHSDYQIFGVCADDLQQGAIALTSYLRALNYKHALPDFPPIEGAIYLKYNPLKQRCHADQYSGPHRGVLVSCQSVDDTDVNETFGHLPLDLFDRV
ncbi:MAG TPA: DUF1824 family protein [Leptolyngbyaceae cyanobacterium M33_DOE_097]|uniref:DUF1824 family protein n=1 Tax=Oscillatoriales cyanobacterium SpSt-418 TaxID=2282169 RepID=A0A7C3PMF1_9CYAN|nr:DUF1824 family protein [Leptolyngbyaceae cyanobacterium M33_DOE_097]